MFTVVVITHVGGTLDGVREQVYRCENMKVAADKVYERGLSETEVATALTERGVYHFDEASETWVEECDAEPIVREAALATP